MIITPKRPRKNRTGSRLSQLVPYMLKGKGGERCTWYMAGNLDGLDRREDAELALSVMELVQDGNVRAKGDKTYHVVISFHPNDRRLRDAELAEIVRKTVACIGLSEHQHIAVRHSDQEHEHLHIAVNKIHPETQKIHHPFRDVPQFKLLAEELEKQFGLHRVDRGVKRMEAGSSAVGTPLAAKFGEVRAPRIARTASSLGVFDALHTSSCQIRVKTKKRAESD